MPEYSIDLAIPVIVVIGLFLFLFGMSQLENGIRSLGYETFKRWLFRSTASPAGSAAAGALTTALLQSSSLVSLLVLAFASAGVLPLYNAIGMILGANLGTTVTGWIVATIGFKLSLEVFAFPLMAGGGLMQLCSPRLEWLRAPGIVLFGLGLIILGLDVMKGAVADLPQQWDLGVMKGHGLGLYFLTGVLIAALIQSSSATMMITLAAVHAGLLDLSAAAALVIGADLGTTSTTVLGSIGGHSIKRQLALAHLLFNIAVDVAAFFFLLPLLPVLMDVFSLRDPLYSLVAFHSLFNLIGLLIFLPLLKPFSRWIGTRFTEKEHVQRPLVGQPTSVPDAALVATQRVLNDVRRNAIVLNLHAFHLRVDNLQLPGDLQRELEDAQTSHRGVEQRYSYIKQQESDLLAFSFDLQEQQLKAGQVAHLSRQVREARALVYSSKTLNDVRENLVISRHSEHPEVLEWYKHHRNFMKAIYRHYLLLMSNNNVTPSDEEALAGILQKNQNHYRESNESVSRMASSDKVTGIELSTMLNVNQEIHHSLKSLFQATQP